MYIPLVSLSGDRARDRVSSCRAYARHSIYNTSTSSFRSLTFSPPSVVMLDIAFKGAAEVVSDAVAGVVFRSVLEVWLGIGREEKRDSRALSRVANWSG